MADVLQNFGQAIPSAGSLTTLFTAGSQLVLRKIHVCNTGSTVAKIRISHAVAGAADTTKQYLEYDTVIPANKSGNYAEGITVAYTDVIRVYSDTGNVTFNAYGVQP